MYIDYLYNIDILSLSPVFSGVHVTWSLVSCVLFCRSLFVLFLLAIVLTALFRYTDSDYLPLVSSNSSLIAGVLSKASITLPESYEDILSLVSKWEEKCQRTTRSFRTHVKDAATLIGRIITVLWWWTATRKVIHWS